MAEAKKKKKANILGRESDAFRDRLLTILGKEGSVTKSLNNLSDRVTLYYTNSLENSDKIYEVEIVEEKGNLNNYTVKFQYGRRGGKMKDGIKGTNLTLDRARIMLRNVVNDKKADRYTENPDGITQQ